VPAEWVAICHYMLAMVLHLAVTLQLQAVQAQCVQETLNSLSLVLCLVEACQLAAELAKQRVGMSALLLDPPCQAVLAHFTCLVVQAILAVE
jgi:hypothetical protein